MKTTETRRYHEDSDSIAVETNRLPLITSLARLVGKVIRHLNKDGISGQIANIRANGLKNYKGYLLRNLSTSMGEPISNSPDLAEYSGIQCYTWRHNYGRTNETLFSSFIFPEDVFIEMEIPGGSIQATPTFPDRECDGKLIGSMVAYASPNWNEVSAPNPINGGFIGGAITDLSREIRENSDGLSGALIVGAVGVRVISHQELLHLAEDNYCLVNGYSVIPSTLVIDTDSLHTILQAKHLARDPLGPRLLEYNFIGAVDYADGKCRPVVFSSERNVHIKYILDCITALKSTDCKIRRIRLALAEQTNGRFSAAGDLAEFLTTQAQKYKPFRPANKSLIVFKQKGS